MLQYSRTKIDPARVSYPPEHQGYLEAQAIMIGLMLAEDCTYEELKYSVLWLTEDNLERVARMIEKHLWPFAKELAQQEPLRNRLRRLIGFRMSRGPVNMHELTWEEPW